MQVKSIACIVGARPNFVKMAALIAELRRRPQFSTELIHTGQHFSPEMSAAFFRELDLPEPDVNLGAVGGTQTEQTAEVMRRLEPHLVGCRPDVVLVVGDVNSTLAAALVAAKLGLPIAHVEAGLRSFDRSMPEEINRIVTDALSEWLFTTEPSAQRNLAAEGIPADKIHYVGNVMIDTLVRFRQRASTSLVLEKLGLEPGSYAVVTLHRPYNVEEPVRLLGLIQMLKALRDRVNVVFPVHPRTWVRLESARIGTDGLVLTPPLPYLDFVKLMSEARLVLTDSGGIQEETTILGVPCLTLRDNTERPITIEVGTNRLAGTSPDRILRMTEQVLAEPMRPSARPHLWDGKASARIVGILEREAVSAPDSTRDRAAGPAAALTLS